MATKVLFIYPALPYDNPVFEHEIPIHLIHLANFLMDRVIPKPVIEVLDLDWERYLHAGFNPFDIEHVERVVKDEIDRVFTSGRDDRLFVLVSCFFTYQYLSTKTLLQAIKNLRDNNSVAITKVILGGYHPTILPADFNGLGVDCLIRGEGELALLEVISRTGTGQVTGEIMEGRIIRNLDDLPLTDFSVYNRYLGLYKHLSIILSRGCPFACNFCVEKKYKAFNCEKAAWRSYSPARAIQEIQNVIDVSNQSLKQCEKAIGFYDPLFGLNDKWLLEVLKFLQHGHDDFRFFAETRIDSLKRENLQLLKDSNVSLMLGLETGSPRMLQLMNKTSDPAGFLGKLEQVMQHSKEIDTLPFALNLMFNFPGETRTSLDETFAYLGKLVHGGGNFTIQSNFYNFYPGDSIHSNLETWEREHGTRIHHKEWWKSMETVTAGHILDASRDLKIRESISCVHAGMKHIFEQVISKEKHYSRKLIAAKKMALDDRTLKKWLVIADKVLS